MAELMLRIVLVLGALSVMSGVAAAEVDNFDPGPDPGPIPCGCGGGGGDASP